MTNTTKQLLAALAAAASLAACGDAPSAPAGALTPTAAPAFNSVSSTLSQTTVGDTVVTVFVVGTNTKTAATFGIGHQSKIDFPYAAGSICDPLTSSYGPGTWDAPCAATRLPTTITAKVWKNAQGKVATDFQPALRFVPGLRKPVLLTLRDAALASTRVDFCSPAGCVDEALADPSLRTILDPNNGFAHRPIKHFSGYTVVVDRSGNEFDGGY